MPKALDMLRKVQRGELPPPPVATLVGFTIGSIQPGRVVTEREAGPQLSSPLGTVHGGILCDLADAAMGMVDASSLEDGESFTTLERSHGGTGRLRRARRETIAGGARVEHVHDPEGRAGPGALAPS